MSDPERAAEIASRQERIADLLRETSTDGVLLLDAPNFAWFTAGASWWPTADPVELPGLFILEKQRWVLCANVDTQRLFDDYLDELGFQVKEWPWYLGRHMLLYGLINGRKLASDQALDGCVNVGDHLHRLRRLLSPWFQSRLRELGRTMAHALEATCRNLERGETEMEVAGQLSHRLIHRGVRPVCVQAVADGRLRQYRRGGNTKTTIEQSCVVQATGSRHGVHVTASRTVRFGAPDESMRNDYDLACRLSAVKVSATGAGASPAMAIGAGQRLLQAQQREHEWRLSPIGWATGFAPVEQPFTPESNEPLQAGGALVWSSAVGSSLVADTYLVVPDGVECVTAPDEWPIRRFKIGERMVDRPDVLQRA